MTIYNETRCELGEGPLWHPKRKDLFWFDILGQKLYSADQTYFFDEIVSAAGWVDHDTLVIATETSFKILDLNTGHTTHLHDLEADKPGTRSNDGRIDPWGGFWIGTMGKTGAPDTGAIYRFYKGELRQLYAPIKCPNSICFSPDRQWAYFSDTTTQVVQKQALNESDGWPLGDPDTYLDLTALKQNPDGAVIDSDGNMWLALWGTSCVSCFNPQGERLFSLPFPASQTSCPAFGGPAFSTLFVTSALEGMSQVARDLEPDGGKTFLVETDVQGQQEHQFLLG